MELDDAKEKMVLAYLTNPENISKDTSETEEEAQPEEETKTEPSESAIFQMYMEELSELPQYDEKAMEQMIQELLDGEQSVIPKLSDAWLPRVLDIAKKYVEPKLLVEDLIQEGNMALFLKLQELCGTKEKQDVKALLTRAVEEGIVAYATEAVGAKELENTVIGKVNLVHEANKLLAEENGKVPTIDELSEFTRMPMEELKDIMDLMKE